MIRDGNIKNAYPWLVFFFSENSDEIGGCNGMQSLVMTKLVPPSLVLCFGIERL